MWPAGPLILAVTIALFRFLREEKPAGNWGFEELRLGRTPRKGAIEHTRFATTAKSIITFVMRLRQHSRERVRLGRCVISRASVIWITTAWQVVA
jgi:hypothetical protein